MIFVLFIVIYENMIFVFVAFERSIVNIWVFVKLFNKREKKFFSKNDIKYIFPII